MLWFCFFSSMMKSSCYQVAHHWIKINCKNKEPKDLVNRNKIKFEPYSDLVDQVFSQFNDNSFTFKTHLVKLKMMKHPRQNTPMKMIQKSQKQTKPLQFRSLCHKYYQIMKLQKHKFLKCKAKRSLQCGSRMG